MLPLIACGALVGCADGYQEPAPEQSAAYLKNLDEPLIEEEAEDESDEPPDFDWATAYTRGVEHMEAGDLAGAVTLFTDCVDRGVKVYLVRANRGFAYQLMGEYEKAIDDFEAVLEPGGAMVQCHLAEILASCPEAKYRDGARALELATEACETTDWQHAWMLAVLAASHAEVGDFEEAVKWQTEALKFVVPEAVGEMERRLALYRAGQPCHELYADPRRLSRKPGEKENPSFGDEESP
jgi:tetratricopeptide (TPR) repeat protein